MITLFCEKKDVESGQFPIEHLQSFGKRTGATIIVRDYAIITYGIIQWLGREPIDRAMVLCEALREVSKECQK